MKTELTLRERWHRFWGRNFLANKNTKEIHYLHYKHANCRTAMMSRRNRNFVVMEDAVNLINHKGYNGCRWCWKATDTDTRWQFQSSTLI